jgi:hypothetical protein
MCPRPKQRFTYAVSLRAEADDSNILLGVPAPDLPRFSCTVYVFSCRPDA